MPELLKHTGELLAFVEDDTATTNTVTVIPRVRFEPAGLFCGHGRPAQWHWFTADESGGGSIICNCPDRHEVVGRISVDVETLDY
jgi:hypothetical protein